MRVLFVNALGILGGSERVLLDLFAGLKALSPEIELGLLCGSEGPLVDAAVALGVDAHALEMPERLARLGDSGVRGAGPLGQARLLWRLGAGALSAGGYALQLRRRILAFRPSLVHSNGFKPHAMTAAALPPGLPRVPVVWHLHDFLGERPLMRHALRALRWSPSLAVANSAAVARDAERSLGGLQIEVVHNGIDSHRFAPSGARADLDALAGLPPPLGPALRVGMVATYARWKGQDVFLHAAARLMRERPEQPWRFYVVGGPVYRTDDSQFSLEELRTLANSLGLTPHVGFIPFQAETPSVYRALDVFVHASTRPEPFGLTIAEAMACGRPALVSQAGGAAELFSDGQDALAIRPGDVGSLADAVLRLLEPALRERLGRAARQSAEGRFNRRRMAAALLALYGGLAAPGAGARAGELGGRKAWMQ